MLLDHLIHKWVTNHSNASQTIKNKDINRFKHYNNTSKTFRCSYLNFFLLAFLWVITKGQSHLKQSINNLCLTVPSQNTKVTLQQSEQSATYSKQHPAQCSYRKPYLKALENISYVRKNCTKSSYTKLRITHYSLRNMHISYFFYLIKVYTCKTLLCTMVPIVPAQSLGARPLNRPDFPSILMMCLAKRNKFKCQNCMHFPEFLKSNSVTNEDLN